MIHPAMLAFQEHALSWSVAVTVTAPEYRVVTVTHAELGLEVVERDAFEVANAGGQILHTAT